MDLSCNPFCQDGAKVEDKLILKESLSKIKINKPQSQQQIEKIEAKGEQSPLVLLPPQEENSSSKRISRLTHITLKMKL